MTAHAVVRVGLIGGGDHARHALADAIGRMHGWSIVAVADPSADARARIGVSLPQARVFDSHLALLSEGRDLDLVIIATPPAPSADILRSAWGTQAAILVEKPGALRSSDLADLQGERPAPVSCAYGYRFHPTVVAFRKQLGDVGAIERLELQFTAPLDVAGTWRASRETGGGALRDLGAHLLDLASCLLPSPLVVEHATIRSTRTGDDEATVDCLAGPVRVRMHCAYHGTPQFSLRASGTTGALHADLWSMTTPARGTLGAIVSRLRTKLSGELRPAHALRRSRMNMLAAGIERAPSNSRANASADAPASIRDAALVLRLIEAAEASSR